MKEYSSITKGNFRRTTTRVYRRWLVAALVLLLLGVVFPWLYSKVSSIVLYPFHVVSTWIATGDGAIPYHIRSRASLISEIESLKQQLVSESGTQLSIRRLVDENTQLRAVLDDHVKEKPFIARVLARPGFLRYDLLQIDKGSNDGIKVGAPVYVNFDSVLGVVAQVEEEYAFVDLFTSPNFVSTAYILGPNVYAAMEGRGGGSARLRLPQGVSLKEGQLVILPGVNSGVYGEVVKVEADPKQPEQYAYVVPTVSLNSLQYVLVGREAVVSQSEVNLEESVLEAKRQNFFVSSTTLYQVADPFATTSASTATTTP